MAGEAPEVASSLSEVAGISSHRRSHIPLCLPTPRLTARARSLLLQSRAYGT